MSVILQELYFISDVNKEKKEKSVEINENEDEINE